MAVTLYHHPFSRAAGIIWPLEECGVSYDLEFVDLMKGDHKKPEIVKLNRMGKLPVLVDGDVVVTEAAAIDLYLADRYAYGRLSPKVDDPRRGTYLRWSFFSPSVVEPAVAAMQGKWEYKPSQAGWGTFDDVLASLEGALEGKDYILGSEFSIADCIVGGTLRFMMMVKAIEPKPVFAAYVERLSQRPAFKKSDEINGKIMAEHGIKLPS